jgi:hypothetical protein
MTEYQRAARMPAWQPRKVAAEITSEMKWFLYIEKKKRFMMKHLAKVL